MKINILCENQVGEKNSKVCIAEWGISLLIEINGVKILFDTGHTDVYIKNAKQLGLNIEDVDFIVLSHYHWDHSGGIQRYISKERKKLVIHPDIIKKLPKKESVKIIKKFEIIKTRKALEFSDNIIFLGEIPRNNEFEKGEYNGDKMLDDSALAIKTDKGAVVLTGCSHSGIVNICEYAKKVTGKNLHAVIGGFHLFDEDKEIADKIIDYFKSENINKIYPMHCVDLSILSRFKENFNIDKLSSGDEIEI